MIWEPYRAAAEMSLGARTVVDGTGFVSNHEFFFAAKPFVDTHPQVVVSQNLGHAPLCGLSSPMSACGPRRNIQANRRDVCFWPLADIKRCLLHARFRV